MTHALLNNRHGIPLNKANRHGLITGQTGTGKTVTLQRLAEQFSRQGVPVFISDAKTDIAALSRSCPTTFLDVFGQSGIPLKCTIAAMGADLLARSLELTDTQAATLEIAFAVASDNRFQLSTIDDLRRVLMALGNEIDVKRYGRVSQASVDVIMRALLRLEKQGGNRFFGSPAFDVAQLLDLAPFPFSGNGTKPIHGLVSILQAERLIQSPRVYGAFLLWMLSDLYERMPEIGDMEKPRLVMFFDEAHLLFTDINPALLRRIELIVRLIRSKGVGVYFVTQAPEDVPPTIREQLAFGIRHSRELRIGHAAFSGIDAKGAPVDHGVVKVDLPDCPLGALSDAEKPQAVPVATIESESRMDLAAWLLLAGVFAWIGALVFAGVWAWHNDHFGKGVAGLLGVVALAMSKK